jgi:hypothetical protein
MASRQNYQLSSLFSKFDPLNAGLRICITLMRIRVVSHLNAAPDPRRSDATLRPLVEEPSTTTF